MLLEEYAPRAKVRVASHAIERASVPAIDAHTHLGAWLSSWTDRGEGWIVSDVAEWLDRMERFGVRGFVNLDGRWGAELRENLARFDEVHPGRVATFCHVDWDIIASGGSEADLGAHLERSLNAGAKGIKVWKDLGLTIRDRDGTLLLPDDERVSIVWELAAERRVPVWWHVGDPAAFFDPVDNHNENFELLAGRPEWSFHGLGPAHLERLLDALEAVVARHPATTFVAVHAGCQAEDLGRVRALLAAYDNLHIDIAARIAQLGRQPRATRALIVDFPDRVLFGTDQIPHEGLEYPLHFRFLETDDECFAHSVDEPPKMGRWTISGLDLPTDVLTRVYAQNAARLVPSLSSAVL